MTNLDPTQKKVYTNWSDGGKNSPHGISGQKYDQLWSQLGEEKLSRFAIVLFILYSVKRACLKDFKISPSLVC